MSQVCRRYRAFGGEQRLEDKPSCRGEALASLPDGSDRLRDGGERERWCLGRDGQARSVLDQPSACAEEADRAAACCMPRDHFSSIRAKRQTASAIAHVPTNMPTMMNPAVLRLKF